jgi:hypothetical protein
MKSFKDFHKQPFRIGVVGYSSGNFDQKKALNTIRERYDEVTIVSGLTNIGIPALAYKYAKEHKLPTVGIACTKATEYDCFPCDKEIIVGKDWGDESDTFLKSIDYLVRVGGGDQSAKEVTKFKTMNGNEHIMEFELERKS